MAEKYAQRIRRRERKFWVIAIFAFALLLISAKIAYSYLGESRHQGVDNLLKGPPQFIVLSLVVAFAVYLRQVGSAAMELRDKIKDGKVRLYPLGQKFTETKLENLEKTYENLSLAAPFLIAITVVVSLRVVFDSILRFESSIFGSYRWFLTIADFLIAEWLSLCFLALAALHFFARRRDERIRAAARDFENERDPGLLENAPTHTAHIPGPPAAFKTANEKQPLRIVPTNFAVVGILFLFFLALFRRRD